MNETRLCYCNKCNKAFNIKYKSKHFNYKSQKRKEKLSVVVKGYELIRPDINKRDSVKNDCATHCYKRYFHTIKNRCLNDFEMTNGDFVSGIISDKKLKQVARKDSFIHKPTMKIYSNRSNMNIHYYLKLYRKFIDIFFE